VTVYIGLLRAINLGGHGKVAMPELRQMVEQLGFGEARTILNSGNVVFAGDYAGRDSEIEAALEKAAAEALGLETDFFVRKAEEWADAIAANPFPNEAKADPSHLVMVCLKTIPKESAVDELRAAVKGRETIKAKGRQLYVTYPDGIGQSKLTMALIERQLGSHGTGRNWNTVLKLQALVPA
jgi:uncharacterized protein (DUF1697 family)